MKKSRRDFITGSAAISVISVTQASAQRARRALPANLVIGLLHSTTYGGDQANAFWQALNDNGGWTPTNVQLKEPPGGQGKGNYEKLQRLAKQLIKVPGMYLIVAAGGLVSAVAVAQALQNSGVNIPGGFVYLIGHYPSAGEGWDIFLNSRYMRGGVNQNTPSRNEKNWQDLAAQQPSDSTIDMRSVALIVNDNAAMSDAEANLWLNAVDSSGNHHADNSVIHHEDYNDDADLPKLFQKIRDLKLSTTNDQPKGLVVSADAYFRSLGLPSLFQAC